MDEEEIIIDDEHEEFVSCVAEMETTCTICQAEFLDPDDLKIHLDQVHKIVSSVIRKCNFCLESYTDLMQYAEHIRDQHLTSLKCCNICWQIFNDFDEYRRHYKKHACKNGSVFKCSQCPQKYSDPLMLKRHEYEHKSDTEGAMIHDVFPFLSAALKVKAIQFLESLETDVVYVCVGCDYSTVDMTTYIRHVKNQICHVFVCERCSSVFKKKKTMAKHVRSKCNIFGIREKKTHFCPDCNTYINVDAYRRHKTHCKPIKCHNCNITFDSMNDWCEHQTKEHAGMSVEVETCKFCWKRCVGSVAMKKHIDKTHKHELHLYKYLCVYCKDVFKHPQKLFGHFVSRHKDIYPYTCKICDKTFHYRKKLTIHIKLVHNSVGYVEFDKNYHVFFTDKKSENPFIPKSIYAAEPNDNPKISSSKNSSNELNSDFMNVTETEGNQTEVEDVKSKLKRKRKPRKEDNSTFITIESSDDNEPLLVVRKRVRLQKRKGYNVPLKKRGARQISRDLLTCKTCKKYCYTYQNYKHHVSLHSKHEAKKCIKCFKIFKSKAKLNEHVALEHSSSKLTETLKTLLEKRKSGGTYSEDLPTTEKFKRTVKKVVSDTSATSAKITAVNHKLSVQKFFENFVPEEKYVPLESNATIKFVTGYRREPFIKMTKYTPSPISTNHKLSLPVKFVDHYPEKVKVNIKLVESSSIEDSNVYSNNYEETDTDRNDCIPEVAEEILLEGCEETKQNDASHKIIIPKLPKGIRDLRIAHLLPQAPYYKIVRVKDVLQNFKHKTPTQSPSSIKLADGTKFIITNPLAHLLGNEQEKVLESVKNKYYKPKNKNFPGMLAKALTMLDQPTPSKKRKRENLAEESS